jgi:hypothetical protein
MKIIDNFLPEDEFKSIQSFMMGGEFRWFYVDGRAFVDDGSFHMTHMFFQPEVGSNSEHLHFWTNFMNKVGAKKCERIKANLTFHTPTIELTEYHSDYENIKTAIFYINTNNGYTEFESGVRVSSVANRVCIFDSNLKHRGTTHTEPDPRRIVVNFNYA